jgi:hypothetical protein
MDVPFSFAHGRQAACGMSPHVAARVTADGESDLAGAQASRLSTVWTLHAGAMMKRPILIAACVIAAQVGIAAIKVQVDVDKTFDFRKVRTWAWALPEAGWIMAARTPTDDPEAIQRLAEPVIMDAVIAEMPSRGLTHTVDSPDVTLKYYLLLTLGTESQTIGQFLPPVAQWGVPPFTASTQSLKVIQRGSLAIDVMSKGQIVWRGVGAAEIKPGVTQDKRAELIRVADRDILRRYPRNQ